MAIEKIDLLSNKREAKKATGGDYVFVVEAVDAKGATIKNVDNDTVAIEGNAADYIVKATGAGVIITKNLDGLTGAELKAAKQFKLTITLQKENAKKGVDAGVVKLAFADGSVDLTRDGKNIIVDGTDIVISKKAKDAAALEIVNADETFDNQVPADDNGGEQPGKSNALTADIDDLTGTAGADTFSAGLTVAGSQTLNGFDTLNGGEGTDTLNATLINAGAVAPTLNSIEVLNLRSINATAEVDLVNATGVEQVWSDRSQNNLTVSNVENLVTVGAKGITENANHTYEVDYAAGTVAATDTQAIVLENADLTLDITQAGGAVGVRNVTIASNGTANVVDFATALVTGAVVRNLTITGAADLEIDSSDAIAATVVDAAAATGDLNLTLALGNAVAGTARSVTLGSGNDTLDASGVDLSNANAGTLKGGAGTDTLIVADANATTDDLVAKVSGFEILQINGLNSARSYATLANLGFTGVTLADSAAGSLTNLTEASKVTLLNTNGGADTVTLAVTGAATNDNASFSFATKGADGNNSVFNVTIADVENLTVSTSDADADVFQSTTLNITSAALEKLTVTGSEAVVFDGTGNAALERVDVSGVTVTTTGANLAADITVGDNVTVIGTATNDSIEFGNQSTVTGGAGDDTFVIGFTGTDIALFSTITDFAAGDVIDFGNAVGTIDEVTLAELGLQPGVNATFQNFVDAAAAAGAGNVSYFAFDGNTYLVQDNNAGAAFAAGDLIVKLTGTVNLADLAADGNTVSLA